MSPMRQNGPRHERLSKSTSVHCDKSGGYVSASDVENKYALASNHASDEDSREMDIDHEKLFDATATEDYRTLIVQRVLSTQMEQTTPQFVSDVPHSQGLSCSSHY
jgi:hypothetical protein